MVEWSDAFGGVPIYIHEAERPWVMRPAPAIRFWSGETMRLNQAMTLIRCGAIFPAPRCSTGARRWTAKARSSPATSSW